MALNTTENFNLDDGSKGVYIMKFILYNINSLSNKTGGEREAVNNKIINKEVNNK